MNTRLCMVQVAVATLFLSISPLVSHAADAVSETFGALVVPVAAATASAPATTYVSVPFLPGAYAGGSISGIEQTRITDALATWTDNQFNGASGRFYLQLTSGNAAGWWSEVAGTLAGVKVVVLSRTLPAEAQLGDQYQIRPIAKLDLLLAGPNAASLKGAGNPSEADNVVLNDASAQRLSTLFRSSVSGFEGWLNANYEAAGSSPMLPAAGWMVRRRAMLATDLLWTGAVRVTPHRVSIRPGLNLLGTLRSDAAATLDGIGLYTGNSSTGVLAAPTLTAADQVLVVSPSGAILRYFYSTDVANPGWRDASLLPASAVAFAPGSAFFVHRSDTLSSFDWVIPPEFTSVSVPIAPPVQAQPPAPATQ